MMPPHELRPFVPGDFASNGHASGNGHDLLNGHGPASGRHAADPNGAADDAPPLDDDDWEAFRRGALDLPDPGTTAPLPEVSPEPPGDAPPPPVPPVDDTAAADPEPPPGPVHPADEPGDGRSRHARPAEDEDYRPPWW